MESLTTAFSTASSPKTPFNDFLFWLIVMLLILDGSIQEQDARREKKRRHRRFLRDVQNNRRRHFRPGANAPRLLKTALDGGPFYC
ncbi:MULTISPECIES: hypothetical protein [unclassified Nitrospina]|uniref:hypothetical protein n=1 Tax=unclassified Nitrospina TaxID=2638683 RepID=UPI003F9C1896